MKFTVLRRRGTALFLSAEISVTTFLSGISMPAFAADGELEGAGTVQNPYQIADEDDLRFVAEQLNSNEGAYVDKSYILTDDIDMTGSNTFPMIGDFGGVLDGQGHTITGMTIAAEDQQSAGFIQRCSGTVKYLTLEDISVSSSGAAGSSSTEQYVGGIVGYLETGGIIAGCTVTGEVSAKMTAGQGIAGGLAGRVDGGAAVQDSFFRGDVSSESPRYSMVGGIAGKLTDKDTASSTSSEDGEINRCLSMANVQVGEAADGGNRSGGMIIGHQSSSNASATGNVAYRGSITHSVDLSTGKTWSGSIGASGQAITGENNLANKDDILVYEPGEDGGSLSDAEKVERGPKADSATADALQKQETYEEIGWDFEEKWEMYTDEDNNISYPVPKYVPQLIDRITVTMYGDPETQRGFTWYLSSDGDAETSVLYLSDSEEGRTASRRNSRRKPPKLQTAR